MSPLIPTKSARIALAVSFALIFLAGIATYNQIAFAFRQFGALKFVPGVIVLSVTRVRGAWGAAVAVCAFLTGALHDRTVVHPANGDGTSRALRATAIRAAIAVPLLYGPVCAVSIAGAVVLAWGVDGLRPHTFVEPVELRDVGYGVVWAVFLGGVPAGWALFGRRVWGAQWHLWRKLLLTYVLLFAASVLLGPLGSLIELVSGISVGSPSGG